ncbi:MAG: hypothetical protein M1374_00830 [Firmicutes bacterium]|nr:hypothetical protein [Bacillota bacterium]
MKTKPRIGQSTTGDSSDHLLPSGYNHRYCISIRFLCSFIMLTVLLLVGIQTVSPIAGAISPPPKPGTDLGGMNLQAYCSSLGESSTLLSPVNAPDAAKKWVCGSKPTNMNAACQWTYPHDNAVAVVSNINNAYSWSCYVSHATANSSSTCTPSIESVGIVKPLKTQSITISGHCLNESSDSKDVQHQLVMIDSHGWNASSVSGNIMIRVRSWGSDYIVISGFAGGYDNGSGGHELEPGDNLIFEVSEPGSRPATYRTKVAASITSTPLVTQCRQQVALNFNDDTAILKQAYSEVPSPGTVLTVVRNGTSVIKSPLAKSILTKSMLTDLRSCAANPDAALGFINGLDASSVAVLAAMIGGDIQSALLDRIVVNAYETNDATTNLAGALYSYRVVSGAEKGLLTDLIPHPYAVIDFLSGLSESEIKSWSQADQGLFGSDGLFEQMSDTALAESWPGYANYAAYPGPLSPNELTGLMYGAVRDNSGRENATASMTSWFLANSPAPSVSDPTDIAEWVVPLANMNMAIAAPTAAFLDSIENWLSAGKTAAAGALLIGADIVTSGILTPYLLALRSGTAADEAIATASENGSTFYNVLNGISKAAETAVLKEDVNAIGVRAWYAIESEQDISDDVQNLKMSPGQKAALAYYLAIEHNTCVEAVVRLLQEHDIYAWQGRRAEELQNSPSIPVAESILSRASRFFIGRSHISVAVLLTAIEVQFGEKVQSK